MDNIVFGRGVLKNLPSLCEGRVAIIADESVAGVFTGGEVFVVPSGEKSKTREMKHKLEDQLLERGFGSDTTIVAVGGGVVTDLAGYVASTYMRGVELILVPTSLLGMVDASIGGKTGVNTPWGKNLIGAYYFPKAVVIDLDLLKTLPEKEWVNGKTEIIKMGLIWDPGILEIEEEAQIFRSIQAKLEVVEMDPGESGLRRILNFGHTIGHAIEQSAGYEIPHGEAVAVGCVAESWLSMKLGYLSEDEFERVKELFPQRVDLDPEKIKAAMRMDKKAKNREPRFVLIDEIGHAMEFGGTYCRTIPEDEIDAMFAIL